MTVQRRLAETLSASNLKSHSASDLRSDEVYVSIALSGTQLAESGCQGREIIGTLADYREREVTYRNDYAVALAEREEALADADPDGAKDWTVVIIPNANHDLIDNGTICQTDGPLADVISPLLDWWERRFP